MTKSIAVVGAGPVGIEAALVLTRKGYDVTVLERGGSIASNVEAWRGVTLFSPNRLNFSKTGLEVLAELNVGIPSMEQYPTGGEFIDTYLLHMQSYLSGCENCEFLFNTEVLQISKQGLTKSSHIGHGAARAAQKFSLLLVKSGGVEAICFFDAVLDATGTFQNPNYAGAGGMAALGELKLRREAKISYYVADAAEVSSSTVAAVIGSGTSAITSLKRLTATGCKVFWVTRARPGSAPVPCIEADPLPQRSELYRYATDIANGTSVPASVTYLCDRDITRLEESVTAEGSLKIAITLTRRSFDNAEALEEVVYVDKVYANCGYRPQLEMTRELQIHYCWASEGPMKLAVALLSASGAGSGDCLAQKSTGADSLRNPEPNFYIVGMKSYGRWNLFLMKIGYEQVAAVVGLLEEDLKTSAAV